MAKTVEVKKFLAKIMPEDVGGKSESVRFVLGNGVEVQACLADYSEETVKRLALHGLSQKIGDSTSGFSKERDFHSAFGAMQNVEDNLRRGIWASRSGGGTSDLVQVLAELQGVPLEAAQAVVDKLDDDMLKTIKSNPTIKKALADLVAKRAAEAAKGAESIEDLMAKIGLGV